MLRFRFLSNFLNAADSQKKAMFRFCSLGIIIADVYRLPLRDERWARLLHRWQAGSAEDLRGDERSGIRPGILFPILTLF